MKMFRLGAMGAAFAVVLAAGAPAPVLAQTSGEGAQASEAEPVRYRRKLDVKPTFMGTVYEFSGGDWDGFRGYLFRIQNNEGAPVRMLRLPGRFTPYQRGVLSTGASYESNGVAVFRDDPGAWQQIFGTGTGATRDVQPEIMEPSPTGEGGDAPANVIILTKPTTDSVRYFLGGETVTATYAEAEKVQVDLDDLPGGDEGPELPDFLPPDPGEAGKATLLGVDSNGNGVRDDVERILYDMFSDDPELLAANMMGAVVYNEQFSIGASGMRENARQDKMSMYSRSYVPCLFEVFDSKEDSDRFAVSDQIDGMRLLMINTPERLEADNEFNRLAGGGIFSSPNNEDLVCSLEQEN